jgi:phosphoribosylformylglycinamidine cyclo-ligase
MPASGLHSNGYSLVRHVFFTIAGWDLERHVDELGTTLGEEMLVPTRIYAQDCLAVTRGVETHGFSHVTGGGLANNLARVLPSNVSATLDRSTWELPPIFGLVGQVGGVAREELERTLNMGVGMVAILPAHAVDAALELLEARGVPSWVAGQVTQGDGSVSMVNDYR